MLKVAEIRVDGLLLERRVNSPCSAQLLRRSSYSGCCCRMRNTNPIRPSLPSLHSFILTATPSTSSDIHELLYRTQLSSLKCSFVLLLWYNSPHIGPSGDRWAMKAGSTISRGRCTTRLYHHIQTKLNIETREWSDARE